MRSPLAGAIDDRYRRLVSQDLAAGALLRRARLRAGLSQTQLARTAGVTQSVISAYESGRRQPALPTLARLVEATGSQLAVDLQPPEPPGPTPLTGPRGRVLREHREEVLRIAAEHGVSGVRVFGSVAQGQDAPCSDVDLLVDLPAGTGLLGLARLQADLEAVLGGPVDVVPADGLRPRIRDDVLAQATAL